MLEDSTNQNLVFLNLLQYISQNQACIDGTSEIALILMLIGLISNLCTSSFSGQSFFKLPCRIETRGDD